MHHSHFVRAAATAAIALVASSSSARAQTTTTPPSGSDPRPVAKAAARTGAVTVDGRLDDAAWSAAPAITDFHQQTPDEGKPPTERTELRILYDDGAIYFGARRRRPLTLAIPTSTCGRCVAPP